VQVKWSGSGIEQRGRQADPELQRFRPPEVHRDEQPVVRGSGARLGRVLIRDHRGHARDDPGARRSRHLRAAWLVSERRPDSATVLQGQQAGAVMSMVDFCTGQLFDWFVSGNTAFTLIERLPTAVTQNTSDPACAGNYAGPNEMYTQIIDEIPISPGVKHRVAIRYTRTPTKSYVEYFLDSTLVSKVSNIGVPLDVQGVNYTGISAAIPGATGEDLRTKINSFSIGHGLLVSSMPSHTSGGGSTSASPGR
jgi:Family of unknown function (DUF6081)